MKRNQAKKQKKSNSHQSGVIQWSGVEWSGVVCCIIVLYSICFILLEACMSILTFLFPCVGWLLFSRPIRVEIFSLSLPTLIYLVHSIHSYYTVRTPIHKN